MMMVTDVSKSEINAELAKDLEEAWKFHHGVVIRTSMKDIFNMMHRI